MKHPPLFTGTATALITPFCDGKIDFMRLARLIEYQLEGGVKTLVLSGTTGESATLSHTEKSALFSFVKNEYGDRLTLLAGCGTCDTTASVLLCRMAQASGANGILAVTPYYNKPSDDGLYLHYKAITEATDLPVIVYQVPGRTCKRLAPHTWARIAELPNIAGLKDAGGDIAMTARYLCACALPVYSGNDDSIVPLMSLGGLGCISVISNLMPAQTQALTTAMLSGDVNEAAHIQKKLLPLADVLFSETNPIPVKWALSRLGFCLPIWRLPLTMPCLETQKRIEKEMESIGLL